MASAGWELQVRNTLYTNQNGVIVQATGGMPILNIIYRKRPTVVKQSVRVTESLNRL